MVEHTFDLVVAGVIPEALVVEVGFINFDRGSLVAKHKFLEGKEAQIPGVSFFIGYEVRECCGALDGGTNFELPDAAIVVSIAHKWSKVFEMFGLVGW